MQNNSSFVNIDLTPEYKQNLRDLAKKYRYIRSDTQSVIIELQKSNFIGDRLQGFASNYFIYKVRVKNSNIQKGKSGGYRLIYCVESPTSVLLLTIYSKSEQEDISVNEINLILDEFYGNE
jgi:mRNA-degrading endonuclease RelE of RelBE toxin-antitoxin system